jgi:hypothetical protein
VEVVIASFHFVPLDAPQPAWPTAVTPFSANPFRIALHGGFHHWYQVQASTNLLAWETLATKPATNPVMDFGDTAAAGFDRRFYRTVTLP